MAELGLSDVEDISDPEDMSKEDSEWDSTVASDLNTPRGPPPTKQKHPPLSARVKHFNITLNFAWFSPMRPIYHIITGLSIIVNI